MTRYHKTPDGNVPFTAEEEIARDAEEKAWADKAPERELKAILNKRKESYPPATDYLDGVVKGDQAQIDKYISDCLAVKDKYPK
jgi:hypothetical protein